MGGRPRVPQREREKYLLCTSVLPDQAPSVDLLNLMHSVWDLKASPSKCLQLQNRITASLLFQVPICQIHLDPDPSRTDYLHLVPENRTGAKAKYYTAAKEGSNKWAATIKHSYTLALRHWSHLLTHPSHIWGHIQRQGWEVSCTMEILKKFYIKRSSLNNTLCWHKLVLLPKSASLPSSCLFSCSCPCVIPSLELTQTFVRLPDESGNGIYLDQKSSVSCQASFNLIKFWM